MVSPTGLCQFLMQLDQNALVSFLVDYKQTRLALDVVLVDLQEAAFERLSWYSPGHVLLTDGLLLKGATILVTVNSLLVAL